MEKMDTKYNRGVYTSLTASIIVLLSFFFNIEPFLVGGVPPETAWTAIGGVATTAVAILVRGRGL